MTTVYQPAPSSSRRSTRPLIALIALWTPTGPNTSAHCGVFQPRAAASAEIPPGSPGGTRPEHMTHSATKGRSTLVEAPSKCGGDFFHNSRTIEFACERRHGARQQLVGGSLRMCRCWFPLCHGNHLVRTLRAIERAVHAVEQAKTLAASIRNLLGACRDIRSST
jgi:hypothetical protein